MNTRRSASTRVDTACALSTTGQRQITSRVIRIVAGIRCTRRRRHQRRCGCPRIVNITASVTIAGR